MRNLWRMFLIVTVLWTARESSAQMPITEPAFFSVTISTPGSEVKIGSTVELTITTKNISAQNIYHGFVAGGPPGRSVDIDLRDSGGNPVLETPYGRKAHGKDRKPWSGSSFVERVLVKPGETFDEKVDLSKEYDLSRAGTYTIQVQRSDLVSNEQLKSHAKMGIGNTVKSNTITITMTP
jgi:hypothetical protein